MRLIRDIGKPLHDEIGITQETADNRNPSANWLIQSSELDRSFLSPSSNEEVTTRSELSVNKPEMSSAVMQSGERTIISGLSSKVATLTSEKRGRVRSPSFLETNKSQRRETRIIIPPAHNRKKNVLIS